MLDGVQSAIRGWSNEACKCRPLWGGLRQPAKDFFQDLIFEHVLCHIKLQTIVSRFALFSVLLCTHCRYARQPDKQPYTRFFWSQIFVFRFVHKYVFLDGYQMNVQKKCLPICSTDSFGPKFNYRFIHKLVLFWSSRKTCFFSGCHLKVRKKVLHIWVLDSVVQLGARFSCQMVCLMVCLFKYRTNSLTNRNRVVKWFARWLAYPSAKPTVLPTKVHM
jgi:hypothetical protein